MADQYYRVAYLCNWCGENFHDITSDRHPCPPMRIYVGYDGKQYCTIHCRDEATKEFVFND